MPSFSVYDEYVTKFGDATNAYNALFSAITLRETVFRSDVSLEKKEMRSWLRGARKAAGSDHELPSILVMPIQRLPRYELLLSVPHCLFNYILMGLIVAEIA